MKLETLTVLGFGRLSGRVFRFGPGLNVVHGPNEAGKSTVVQAIVALLYGLPRGRKEIWRPWNRGPYAATLTYVLADGSQYEIQRDFDRDAKGIRVYDRDGRDVAAELAIGRTIVPGEAHLKVPLEAFVNASCVAQQAVAIDGERSSAIATSMARALDGGPKEDAALGARERLENARKTYVGTPRATVNNPLRALRERLTARSAEASAARTLRDSLAARREQRMLVTEERARRLARRGIAERSAQAMRAAELRARLEALREYREDLAARQTDRAQYDDVAAFPAERATDLSEAFYAWHVANRSAESAEHAAAEAQLDGADLGEMAARIADAGTIDDPTFDALQAAALAAEEARARATAAANEAAAARREGEGGRTVGGAALLVATLTGILTIGFAIAHWWAWTEVVGLVAALAFGTIAVRGRERVRRGRQAAEKQRLADEALAVERDAALRVAAVLEPIAVSSVEELGGRRRRLAELRAKAAAAQRAVAEATRLRADEAHCAAAFDALAAEIVPDVAGPRDLRRRAAEDRATRRRRRDGIDNAIAMLAVRRSEILRGAEEFTLVAERERLEAAGIIPADEYVAGRVDEFEGLVEGLDADIHRDDITLAEISRELDLGEAAAAAVDIAEIEEDVERLTAEVARIEAFDRALTVAVSVLEDHTREAHQAFARRLETYAADTLNGVTGGRYGDIRLDPATLEVRVRVPETGAIEPLAALSAGTIDQVYLIVRLAMARMLGEGLETPPLLLDDPFAYWDAERIERCLPLIARNAFDAQTILFSASDELAAAAQNLGAVRIDLAPTESVQPLR